MNQALLQWRSYSYFPYEREFASLEVQSVLGTIPEETPLGLHVPASTLSDELFQRLTYFSRAVEPTGQILVPVQARLEASASGRQEKQATRYSAHGLHEYKGKFNPQVVRAVGNILGLEQHQWVLDPFLGSGTTLLEAAHIGWNAVGADLNPLAVRIANAKIRAFKLDVDFLEGLADRIVERVEPLAVRLCGDELDDATIGQLLGPTWQEEIPQLEYLSKWFTKPVLAQLVTIKRVLLELVPDREDRGIFEVILSDHLRDTSLQEPADLRIRRRKEPHPNYPLLKWFVRSVPERIAKVTSAKREIPMVCGSQRAFLADMRKVDAREFRDDRGSYDAVITSPPYATALPYVDTQRLSLVALGELGAKELGKAERQLIGAREIATRERRALEAAILRRDAELPSSVLELCSELLSAAEDPSNGFRRKNKPALVLRYFRDMATFFGNLRDSVRKGAPIALVVGVNRTTLGGRVFEIDTPQLLLDTAVHMGYRPVLDCPMNTYQRYELHQRNSIDAERLIVVAAP